MLAFGSIYGVELLMDNVVACRERLYKLWDDAYKKAVKKSEQNDEVRESAKYMQDWEKRLNSFIEMFDYGLLKDAGNVSAEIAKLHAETEFEKYRVIQDKLFMSDFDKYLL